jgi:hypothetical protein
MCTKSSLAAIVFALIVGSSTTSTASNTAIDPDGGELEVWTLTGPHVVDADAAVLSRIAGSGADANVYGTKMSIRWADARLVGNGIPPMPVRLELHLTLGHAMPIGLHTAYPGLITPIEDARGTLENLGTGFAVNIRLSHQGTWIGKFIHSNSAGSGQLALELPFSLHDATTDAILAENSMIFRLDSSVVRESIESRVLISPTPHPELRRATTDIGGVLAKRIGASRQTSTLGAQNYEFSSADSTVSGIGGRDPFEDLFSIESLALFESDTGEWLSLSLESKGLVSARDGATAPLSLYMRFMPALVDPDSRSAWLEQVAGEILFRYAHGTQTLRITPGNHGLNASRVFSSEDGVRFDFAVALHPAEGAPSLARLTIDCSSRTHACSGGTLISSLAFDSL